METQSESRPAAGRAARVAGIIGLIVLLGIYGAFLFHRFYPAITEPDANGYWAQGSLMVQTGHTSFRAQSDAQYIGMHWLLTPNGDFISRYPPGLPALIGLIYATLGYKASVLVNPILALLSVAGIYLTTRRLFHPAWALLAAALLACDPIFTEHAIQNFAHMGVTACVVWGLYFLILWSQHGKSWQIFVAGIILGCIPTIRYPDAVLAVGVGAFLLMQWRRPQFSKPLLIATSGAMIPIIPLLIRNQLLLGAFWRTGYALTNEQTGFGWGYFKEHWASYLFSLNGEAMGLLFALGIVAIVLMLCLPQWRPLGLLLGLMIAPMTLLYMAYYWSMGGAGTMRFLVPIVPCFVLGSVWLLHQLVMNSPMPARIAVPLAVLLLQFGWAWNLIRERPMEAYSKQVLVTVTNALEESTQPGDVIVAQNQMLQHLDFVRHWKLADASLVDPSFGGRGDGRGPGGPGGFALGPGGFVPGPGGFGGPGGRGGFAGPGGRRGGRRGGPMNEDPDAPAPMQAEKMRTQRELYQSDDAQQQFAADVRSWAGDGKVFVVGPESQVRQAALNMAPDSELQIVRRVPLPPSPINEEELMQPGPGMGPRRGGRGGPMGPGGFAGPGARGGRGGRGGPMGGLNFNGETELVIAQWNLQK